MKEEYPNALTDDEAFEIFEDLSCITEESNGVVHYYDEEGFEEATFIPGWGC